MHVFKHPKYYKELRERNKSDQVISDEASTEATSLKLQAGGCKLHDSWTTEKFHGTRTKGLYHDKCIVWMFNMKANLVWWESYFIPLTYLQFYSEKVARTIAAQ